jgi:leucine rich repeat domain protein (fragment)
MAVEREKGSNPHPHMKKIIFILTLLLYASNVMLAEGTSDSPRPSNHSPHPNTATEHISFETTKAIGETITMRIENKAKQSKPIVEGATFLKEIEREGEQYGVYELTSQQVVIKGNISFLYCERNNITKVDLTHAATLWGAQLNENQISEIDVSNNVELTQLRCDDNNVSILDLTSNSKLRWLSCNNNQIRQLTLPKKSELLVAYCSFNKLTTLDISGQNKLEDLFCFDNKISRLDLSQCAELLTLACHNNVISELKIPLLPKLYYLNCNNNRLTSIDVTQCPKLREFGCANNQIRRLNITKNPDLNIVNCNNNLIPFIDVSQNTSIKTIAVAVNKLTTIDLSNNTELEKLNITLNRFTELDVSKNKNLRILWCDRNNIKGAAMDRLIESLPKHAGQLIVHYSGLGKNEDNEITQAQVKKARDKEWIVTDNQNENYGGIDETVYPGQIVITTNRAIDHTINLDITANGSYKIEGAQLQRVLVINSKKFYQYKVTAQTIVIKGEVTGLECNNGEITSIDLTQASKLTSLSCHENKLKSIDVSNNSELAFLRCNNNEIKSLDLSQNSKLKNLICHKNNISHLDLSFNHELTHVECCQNHITGADTDYLIDHLPATSIAELIMIDKEEDNNEISREQIERAKAKGWRVLDTNNQPVGIGSLYTDSRQELEIFDLSGRRIFNKHTKGIVIIKQKGRTTKTMLK